MPSEAELLYIPDWDSLDSYVQQDVVNIDALLERLSHFFAGPGRDYIRTDVAEPPQEEISTEQESEGSDYMNSPRYYVPDSQQKNIAIEHESNEFEPQRSHKLVRPSALSAAGHHPRRRRKSPRNAELASVKARNSHLISRLRAQKQARRAGAADLLHAYQKIFELKQSLTHLSNRVVDFATWGEEACGEVASMQGQWQEFILYWARELSAALPEKEDEEQSSEDSE